MADSVTRTVGAPHAPIPGYRMIRVIGRGAFGEVWLAEEQVTGRLRAVKLLCRPGATAGGVEAADERETEGLRAYQRASEREHSHLLQIHHAGRTEQGRLYYVMELADPLDERDTPLSDRYRPKTLDAVLAPLRESGRGMPAREALEIVAQVLTALSALHDRSLAHHDVKPSNVLFVGGAVKLGDPGLVAKLSGQPTRSGTPGYVPPDGRSDHEADLYAAGKLLYVMVTGIDPTQWPDLPWKRPPSREDAPYSRAALRILNKAARPDAARGYKTAREMLEDVRAALQRRAFVRRILLAGAIAGLLVAVTIAAAYVAVVWRRAPTDGLTAPRLASVQRDRVDPQLWKLDFSDGSTRRVSLGAVTGLLKVDIEATGMPLVVVGDSDHNGDGRLRSFNALELATVAHPRPLHSIVTRPSPPKPWNLSDQDAGVCTASPVLAEDLDGQPGDEMLVAFERKNGPAQLVLLTRGWRRVGSYWHFGWPRGLSEAANVQGDHRKELVLYLIGNERSETGPQQELYHAVVMILRLEDFREPDDPGAFWSVNEWMNRHATAKPWAYGFVSGAWYGRAGSEEGWSPTSFHVDGGRNGQIEIQFKSGAWMKLDHELSVIDVQGWHPEDPNIVLDRSWADRIWTKSWPKSAHVDRQP